MERVLGFAVLCVLFSVVLAEPFAPAPPNVSAIFSAVISARGLNGNFYYNSELGAYALAATSVYFGDYDRFDITLFTYSANYFILNNVCRANLNPKAKFSDLFAWITDKPYYLGTKIYKGAKVEVWANEPTDDAKYLLYAVGQVPVFFRFPIWGTNSPQPFPISLDFVEYVPGPFDSSILRTPSQCYGHGFTCQGSVSVVDIYRFHDKGDYNLTDTNSADNLGEVGFLCDALTKPYTSSSISHFQVQMNTAFGQYALCNNGQCLGVNLNAVGQGASFGVKWNGGQCLTNTDVGNWYSLPHAARCSGKQDPSSSTCGWKIQNRVKTIDVKCLLSNQFLTACGTRSGSTYYGPALQVLTQSFSKCPSIKLESDDSSTD